MTSRMRIWKVRIRIWKVRIRIRKVRIRIRMRMRIRIRMRIEKWDFLIFHVRISTRKTEEVRIGKKTTEEVRIGKKTTEDLRTAQSSFLRIEKWDFLIFSCEDFHKENWGGEDRPVLTLPSEEILWGKWEYFLTFPQFSSVLLTDSRELNYL